MVSAKHQHESAIGIYMSLPLEPPTHLPPHTTPLGCHRKWFELPASYSKFPLAIYFISGNAYVSMILCQFYF